MAQLQPSTLMVTPTVGDDWINLPINPKSILRAYATNVQINGADLNLYPAIQFDLVTEDIQYWIYALGDTVTRDADLAIVDDAINSGGGGAGSGPLIETNKKFVNTSTYTILDTDYILRVMVNSTLSLPVITSSNDGIVYRIFARGVQVRVNAAGSDLINNNSFIRLRRYQMVTLRSCLTDGWSIGD